MVYLLLQLLFSFTEKISSNQVYIKKDIDCICSLTLLLYRAFYHTIMYEWFSFGNVTLTLGNFDFQICFLSLEGFPANYSEIWSDGLFVKFAEVHGNKINVNVCNYFFTFLEYIIHGSNIIYGKFNMVLYCPSRLVHIFTLAIKHVCCFSCPINCVC